MKVAVLSNINLDSLGARLKRVYDDVFLPAGFNTWMQQLFDSSSAFSAAEVTDCFVILDGAELVQDPQDWQEPLNQAISCIEAAARRHSKCNFYIADLDIDRPWIADLRHPSHNTLTESMWQEKIVGLSAQMANVFLFSMKDMVREHGRPAFYSDKMWYLSAGRLSAGGEKLLLGEMKKIVTARYVPRKKCLVLDLDNTLWGGVIGEDGVQGIELDQNKEGARFKDFQRQIQNIQVTGVILAIASKNNVEDVAQAFSHPHMLLKEHDFIVRKINWQPKSVSLQEIAKELNIGLDSLVFVDDNPVEREAVRQALPMVAVPDFPDDTCTLPRFAKELYDCYFFVQALSKEDRAKSNMYRENIQRKEAQQAFTNIEDFFASMDIQVKVVDIDESNLQRACQMLHKTNQFNLTTKRYTEEQVRAMMQSSEYLLYLGHVTDKFGDNGLSLLFILRLGVDYCEIDTLLMSCRIMGRTIEFGVLTYIEKILMERGIRTIRGVFIPTEKNVPVAEIYDKLGFSLTSVQDGIKYYEKSLPAKEEGPKCFATFR